MAVAGDIMIKVAADLAEFTRGMTEAASRLEDFGKHAKQTGDNVTNFIGLLKTGFAALGVEQAAQHMLQYAEGVAKSTAELKAQAQVVGLTTDALQAYQLAAIASGSSVDTMMEAITRFNRAIGEAQLGSKQQIDVLNQLGVKILDVNGKLRPQTDLLTEVAQALLKVPEGAQRAAAEIALFGRSGQQINPILQQLAQGVGTLQEKFKSGIIPEETIERMHEFEQRSELASKEIAAITAQLYAPIKGTFIEAVLALMKELEAVSYRVGDALRAIGVVDTPRTAAADLARVNNELAITSKQLDYITEQQKRASDQGVAQNVLRDMDKRAAQLAQRKAELQAEQQRILFEQGQEQNAGTLPAVTVTGARNPPTKEAAKQAEDIEALIRRYQQMTKAANDARDQIRTNTATDIDDLGLVVKAKEEAQNIIANIEKSKGALDPGIKKQLEDAVQTAKLAQAEEQRQLQYATQAEALERRLGDGTKAHQVAVRDLNRELATGRLSQDAYNRALKEQEEAINNAALAAKRYDDNLGSLVAGFEHAANAYARSNDLYTQGGELFNGITNSMMEGLDALQGKSTKTFGDIALEFARMLEQMAIKAAASAVFSAIFGSMTGMAGAGTPGNPYFGPVNPNAGGGLFGFLGGLFSGGRAGGGPVQPGMSYTVGESGPERFVPAVAGTIQPHAADPGGGVTVNLDMGSTQGAANPTAALEFGRRVRAAVVDVIAQEKRPGGTLYRRVNA